MTVDASSPAIAANGVMRGRCTPSSLIGPKSPKVAFTRRIPLTLLMCFLLAFVAPGCASSQRSDPRKSTDDSGATIPTSQGVVELSVRDCLAASGMVAASLRSGDTASANGAQEICRNAMITLDTDALGTQLGTRSYAMSVFISDLNSAVAAAIRSAEGGALSVEGANRLDAEYRSSATSIQRLLDPNYPFIGMHED